MADNKIDEVSKGLGDLSATFTDRSVSDMSWLNVDIEEYRKYQALPKQNLDSIPELVSALIVEKDERIPQIIPLRPHAIVNTNPLDAPAPTLRQAGSVKNRVAQYVMTGMIPKVATERLKAEFSPQQLAAASEDVASILENRGLIGNVYVDASHLPRCSQDSSDRDLVRKHASRAIYVVAKSDCTGCIHNTAGVCRSLGKRIVDEVPYDHKTIAHYSAQLATEGRPPAGIGKVHLKMAFLTPPPVLRSESILQIRTQQPVKRPIISQSDVDGFVGRMSAKASAMDALPGPAYLAAARAMMEGKTDASSVSYSPDPSVRSLAAEHGLIGHSWIDADALGGPRQAAAFITRTGSRPDYVLFRSPTLEDTASGAVLELQKVATVVAARPPVSRETFLLALQRAVLDDRITRDEARNASVNAKEGSDWRALTARVNLHVPAPLPAPGPAVPVIATKIHYGDPGRGLQAAAMDPEEVRRSVSHMMNTGLYGKKLQAAILSRYTREDLSQVQDIGQRLASLDGVQGDFFIDPTAYSDYGTGCRRGSEQFKKRGAANVLASDKCTGCTLQTAPGWCSRYAKNIIRKVPDIALVAGEARRRLPVVQAVPAGLSPVEKFGLASDPMAFEIPVRPAARTEVKIADKKLQD